MIKPACEEGSRKEDDAKEKSKDKAKNPTKTHPCCWRWCCNTCNAYVGQGKDKIWGGNLENRDKNLENWDKNLKNWDKNLENWDKNRSLPSPSTRVSDPGSTTPETS